MDAMLSINKKGKHCLIADVEHLFLLVPMSLTLRTV
jgi:hypothetical protein